MLRIERIGDLAAETGPPCMRGQQTGLQANDDWSKMKMIMMILDGITTTESWSYRIEVKLYL